jgi:pimeloyl-ACP methyl ester carboxylesterase
MKDPANDSLAQSFYEGVPEDQKQHLGAFRQRFPYSTMQLGESDWHYIDTQDGEQVVFILAGATTIAEISFNTIEHLAEGNRVIAPDYPPIDNLAQLFDGYITMLDRLGVDQLVVMGGSYGGWMAQSLVRLIPDRTDKVVLSAIGPPNPENSRQLAKMLWMFKLMPYSLLRALMNRSFSRLVSEGELQPVQMLMMAQLKEIMHTRVGRKDILAALLRLIDQTENYHFGSEDLADWPGKMLVLMGSDDPSTTPDKRDAMAVLYPQAEHVVFEGADHSISVTHKEQYYLVLDSFLTK